MDFHPQSGYDNLKEKTKKSEIAATRQLTLIDQKKLTGVNDFTSIKQYLKKYKEKNVNLTNEKEVQINLKDRSIRPLVNEREVRRIRQKLDGLVEDRQENPLKTIVKIKSPGDIILSQRGPQTKTELGKPSGFLNRLVSPRPT